MGLCEFVKTGFCIGKKYFMFRFQMVQLKNSPKKNQCNINGSLYPYAKTPLLNGICPLIIIFLQFGITAMFMWMLCEGIHLNNVLTVSVFKNRFKNILFLYTWLG